jgi:hypothetical protein
MSQGISVESSENYSPLFFFNYLGLVIVFKESPKKLPLDINCETAIPLLQKINAHKLKESKRGGEGNFIIKMPVGCYLRTPEGGFHHTEDRKLNNITNTVSNIVEPGRHIVECETLKTQGAECCLLTVFNDGEFAISEQITPEETNEMIRIRREIIEEEKSRYRTGIYPPELSNEEKAKKFEEILDKIERK